MNLIRENVSSEQIARELKMRLDLRDYARVDFDFLSQSAMERLIALAASSGLEITATDESLFVARRREQKNVRSAAEVARALEDKKNEEYVKQNIDSFGFVRAS